MRVHFDDQIAMHQPRGGVSRYFVELVRAYQRDRTLGVTPDFDWRLSRNVHVVDAGLGRSASRTKRRLHRVTQRLPPIPGRRPDVYHSTYYYPDRLPPTSGPPMVATVHDMIPELFPEFWPNESPHLAKEAWVRRADAIVCISESTRRDLLAIYGPLDAAIDVVPLGVGDAFRPGRVYPGPLPDEFLLFLGLRANYKDFGVAAEAFAVVHRTHPGLVLIVVGGGRFTGKEKADLKALGIERSVQRLEATDAELAALFGSARAFVFPSRYEGFGLPTLEAMACGTCVVLPDSSSHPEVGGDAALYFPPGDADALASQLLRLLGDPTLRASLRTRGLERAAMFTWLRTASLTRDVYAALPRRG